VSKTLAVAARELRERWLLFPAGLVFGLGPVGLPAFGLDRDVIPVAGIVGAVLLGAAAALIMGSTMLARDAANGRLAFLFARPLSWPAIWGGKWLAALVLVPSTSLLAAVPFMAVYSPRGHGGSWLRAMADGPGAAFFLTLLVLGLGLANFAATAYRSRSAWLALDLGLLAAGIWAARHAVAPLWRYRLVGQTEWSAALSLVPLALAVLLASAVQTAYGRTDVRRAHVSMSVVFWAVVGLNLAVAAGYWHWVRAAGPPELQVHALARDPAGRFVYVESSARRGGDFPYAHWLDTRTGRWASRPELSPEELAPPYGVLFSSDGRLAVAPGSDGRGAEVVRFDLTRDPLRATHVSLESSPPPDWRTSFALSPTGATLLMVHESGASIFELPSGRRVATTTIPPGWRPAACRFVGETTARAWLVAWNGVPARPSSRAEMRIVDLAADGRSSVTAFPIEKALGLPFQTWGAVRPDARGDRLVTSEDGVYLRDGATGALLATLSEPEGQPVVSARTRFLADGRIVVARSLPIGGDPGQGTTLAVFDHDGASLSETRLELPPPGVSLGPEIAPGRLLVTSFRSAVWDTLVVDLAEDRVVDRLDGLRTELGFWWGPAASAEVGGEASVQFLRDAEDHLFRVDFSTGERTVVAGPGAPEGERVSVGW